MTQTYLIKNFSLALEPLHGDVIDRRFKQLLARSDVFGKHAAGEGDLCEILA